MLREQKGEGDVTQLSARCCMNCMLYIFAGDLHWFCCFGTTTGPAGASGCLWLLLEVPPGTGNKDVFFLSPCRLLSLFLSFTLPSPATGS